MRHRLANGDTVDHPRFGVFTVHTKHRDNVIPPDTWQGWKDGVQVTPLFYSERGLHFFLRRTSRRKPPYAITTNAEAHGRAAASNVQQIVGNSGGDQ